MEWIPIKDRMPDKNGKYLVIIQMPSPNCSYVGQMPWSRVIEVREYVVEPQVLGEVHKVPYWVYVGEKDYTFFITHWAKLPKLPADVNDHRPDQEEAVSNYFKLNKGIQVFYGK